MKTDLQQQEDAEVRRVLDWFISFIGPGTWLQRKAAIEAYLDSVVEPRGSCDDDRAYEPISIADDRMAWYMYLAETFLSSPLQYEYFQGSRVLPIFKRLGSDFELLMKIGGIQDAARRLTTNKANQPDSALFEMLVAVLWAKNGWHVDLIAPAPPEKRPDIRAASQQGEWFVECKRMAQNSGCSRSEREKWLTMWCMFRGFLERNRLPYLLDIVFHVELDSLPDRFLRDELPGKLRLAVPPCTLIANEIWDVGVTLVDLIAIQKHLKKNYVKCPSMQMNELIGGRRDSNRGFTSMFLGKSGRMGPGGGCNVYIDSIEFAAGAFWHCDAERAIEQKARDIRGHLAEAVQQLPAGGRGAIHIGMETLDGPNVEADRYARIMRTIDFFDPRGKDLRWIYCHLFQPYAPTDQAWVYDETVYRFSLCNRGASEPIDSCSAVVGFERGTCSGVHWLREPP